MIKIFKSLKFRESENKMKYVGDVKNAISDFESKKLGVNLAPTSNL